MNINIFMNMVMEHCTKKKYYFSVIIDYKISKVFLYCTRNNMILKQKTSSYKWSTYALRLRLSIGLYAYA